MLGTVAVRKTYFSGTHRVRTPQQTLDLIEPLMAEHGVTRLADVTGLDVLGLPVVVSVRPLARTLSVSQGKGVDLVAAKVSAAMEAFELHYAESAVPLDVGATPACRLDLDYHLHDLEHLPSSLMTDRLALDWVEFTGVLSGTPCLVPREAVVMDLRAPQPWRPFTFISTSNGLASGNVRGEALVHALYEAVERDAVSAMAPTTVPERRYIALDTVDDPTCRRLIDQIRAAGGWVELVLAPGRWAVPVIVCYLWMPDFAGTMMAGSGAHSDPSVALSRALTEAAQTRLTYITGTRDDLPATAYRPPAGEQWVPVTPPATIRWAEVSDRYPRRWDDIDLEAAALATALEDATGSEPLVLDLAERPEFSVVKVVCPGLRMDVIHDYPRLER